MINQVFYVNVYVALLTLTLKDKRFLLRSRLRSQVVTAN